MVQFVPIPNDVPLILPFVVIRQEPLDHFRAGAQKGAVENVHMEGEGGIKRSPRL